MASNGTILDPSGQPVTGHNVIPVEKTASWSARDLMRYAREHPPESIMQGLLNKGDILLLHGSEESFKSMLVLQIAECIANGTPLLRYWKVPRKWRVGVIETEIHEVMLGERLAKMFPKGNPPENLCIMGES